MRFNNNIRNNEAFSHRRFVNVDRMFDVGFARDGYRSVQLIVQGQILNVSERVETIAVDMENIMALERIHTLTVFGLAFEQEGIAQSDVISALREYDETNHRQAIVNTAPANRLKCSLDQKPRRSS